MKKVLTLVLTLVLTMSLCTAMAEENPYEGKKIAIVTATESFEFFIKSQQGMRDTLDAAGIEWTLYNWDLDMDRQIEYLTQCMAMEYDAVICSFYDNSVANNVLEELNAAGIIVVTWEAAPSVPELAKTTVLSNDYRQVLACGRCRLAFPEGQCRRSAVPYPAGFPWYGWMRRQQCHTAPSIPHSCRYRVR